MLLLYPAASGARSITSVGVGQGADGSVRTPYSRSDCRNIGFSMNDGIVTNTGGEYSIDVVYCFEGHYQGSLAAADYRV